MIGYLNLYMIAADLVSEGHIDEPTVLDISKIIRSLKAGGGKGLFLLELLNDEDEYSEKEVFDAVTNLDGYVRSQLTEDEQKDMGYGMVMLEHALCKFLRAVNNGCYPQIARRIRGSQTTDDYSM